MLFKGRDLRLTLLLRMEKEPITRRKVKSLYVSWLGYHNAIKFLRECGLVVCDGVDERNQKIWALSPKGRRFVELLYELKKLLMADAEG